MAKVICLLQSKTENISYTELQLLQQEYYSLLKNKFQPPPKTGDCIEMIQYLKRKDETQPFKIGPYENITPFEAANRIASDLVIIKGLRQLIMLDKISSKATFTLRLGTKHEKQKGDFSIITSKNSYEGEAFNVAPSFYKDKLNQTLSKWRAIKKEHQIQLKYMLINNEAVKDSDYQRLHTEGIKLIGVKDWFKK
ncbi:MAG: hypothetical protein IPJ86_14400 [Bacteroidetes bacterium]|nr:hypothetical protein [Bacteroidota bacterium]